jgi:hypothetical protein
MGSLPVSPNDKLGRGARGSKIVQKKCHVLFEWHLYNLKNKKIILITFF